MNDLYELLKENAAIYKQFLDLEYNKYEAVIQNDINALDDIVSKEQVFYMKTRGSEQKREKLIASMGMSGKTLKEIIDLSDINYKEKLSEQYEELSKTIIELKKINSLIKTLVEVRLHKIKNAMSDLGEKENTYSSGDSKNNSHKSILFSQKI